LVLRHSRRAAGRRYRRELGKLENIGLLVDSFHWHTSGGTPMDLASIPTWQVVHVHVNDAPNLPREQQQTACACCPAKAA
jgi:sugar phosphate isomerase/epimerase